MLNQLVSISPSSVTKWTTDCFYSKEVEYKDLKALPDDFVEYNNDTSQLKIYTEDEDYVGDRFIYCWTASSQGGESDFIGFNTTIKVEVQEAIVIIYRPKWLEGEIELSGSVPVGQEWSY